MVYSSSKKFIYLAVPKTGSTTITRNLTNVDGFVRNKIVSPTGEISVREHAAAQEIIPLVGSAFWEEHYSCGFVRNPFSRVVSAYCFYRDGRAAVDVAEGRRKKLRTVGNVLLAKVLPFNVWLQFFRPSRYIDYLGSPSGKVLVDEVYRFENLATDYESMCNKVQISLTDLTQQNVTDHAAYTEFYNSYSRSVVEKYFKSDLDAFGYSYGD